jgi:hypothetical protein
LWPLVANDFSDHIFECVKARRLQSYNDGYNGALSAFSRRKYDIDRLADFVAGIIDIQP